MDSTPALACDRSDVEDGDTYKEGEDDSTDADDEAHGVALNHPVDREEGFRTQVEGLLVRYGRR